MIIYVQAEHNVTQLGKKKTTNCMLKKIVFGDFDTNTYLITSSTGECYSISRDFDKFYYKNRIVFVNKVEKNSEQWILTLIPSPLMLDSIGVSEQIESDSDFSSYSDESDASEIPKNTSGSKTKCYSDCEEESQEPYSESDSEY